MTVISNISDYRKPGHDIAPIFINRWSPLAMSGKEISREDLMRLFEAAQWAPSSMNSQPWRFLYAMRNTGHRGKFFNILTSGSQRWCRNAATLVVISKTTFDFNRKPARTNSYDSGAAWISLAFQGSFMGLVVHGMQGFNYDRAKTKLKVNDEYQVDAMFAVGRPGNKGDLPPHLQEREFSSARKKLEEIVFEGGLGV